MENQIIENQDGISFHIKKKNPKKNAKTYQIETIQDIFDAVNSKNLNKFMREFKVALLSGFVLRAVNESLPLGKQVKITMPKLEWTDD